MINVLRRHQRWLLLVIAIVTIVAFAWLYNDTDLRRLGLSRVAEMYGRTIYQPEVDRIVRLYQLAAVLGLDKFLASLSLTASSEQDALNEFIINYFVLRHESEELWIEPTSQQIVEAIRSLPSLQINGTFDRGRYLSFVQEQLAPRGITERQLEQLIRDSLCLDRIWKIVTSPIAVTLADISSALQQYQKTDVIVVKIPPGNATQLADPTEEEIQKFYESNREMFQIPERRVAEVASFTLDAEQRKLEGKSKVEALQELADRASKFQEVASKGEGDFAALAKSSGAEITLKRPISLSGREENSSEENRLPAFAVKELFRLTQDSPVSDVIQDQEAFLVLRLKEIEPERQQKLEECRERVKSILKQRKADAAERDRANRLRSEVIEANRKGTPFAEAARSKGLEVEEYQQLEPWQTSLDLSSVYARVSAEMNPGETSPIAAGPDGYAFLHLLRRYPLDPEIKKQKEPLLTANALDAKRAILFADWIRHAREKAKLRFYQR